MSSVLPSWRYKLKLAHVVPELGSTHEAFPVIALRAQLSQVTGVAVFANRPGGERVYVHRCLLDVRWVTQLRAR